jgi:hypothetical protein
MEQLRLIEVEGTRKHFRSLHNGVQYATYKRTTDKQSRVEVWRQQKCFDNALEFDRQARRFKRAACRSW